MMGRVTGTDTLVGLISDTHGLLRPEAVRALAGAQRIVHAGDIGKPEVLKALNEVAPVEAVRGNNDTDEWAAAIPEHRMVKVAGVSIYVIHDLQALDIAPMPSDAKVIVSGHSHRPAITERNGVLFVNPGSAGRRRFSLPVTLGLLHIRTATARAEIVQLL